MFFIKPRKNLHPSYDAGIGTSGSETHWIHKMKLVLMNNKDF
uniref:Uncharacterized protein n=1 Tax=Anguilla anguilla TaxID=7936 RepID=A0A0E9TML3_ANGAN